MSQTNKSYRKLFDMLLSDDDLVTKQLIKNIKEEYDKHHQPNFKAIERNILEIREINCPYCGSFSFVSNGHTKMELKDINVHVEKYFRWHLILYFSGLKSTLMLGIALLKELFLKRQLKLLA